MTKQIRRILIIDPDEALRATLARRLREIGHETHVSTYETEQMMAVRRNPSDLVILDPIFDASMDKHRVIRLFSYCQGRGIKVFVLTNPGTLTEEALTKMYRGIGAAGIMTKPFSMPRLIAAVNHVLEES